MVISLAMGKLNFSKLSASLFGTLKSSTMVLTLVISAMVFSRFLTITRLPYEVADWTAALHVPSLIILLAILGIYILGGALMDALGFLIISIPIFIPLLWLWDMIQSGLPFFSALLPAPGLLHRP